MPSKLDSIPTSWKEANQLLDGADGASVGNNTVLYRRCPLGLGGEHSDIDLLLHNIVVVAYQSNGVTVLRTGGYRTVTTRDRLNRALKGTGYQVHQHRGRWLVSLPGVDGNGRKRTVDFVEGFVCHVGGGVQHDAFQTV